MKAILIILLSLVSWQTLAQTCGVRTLHVSLSGQTTNTATITWSGGAGTQYNILSTEDEVNYVFLTNLPPSATSYTATGLQAGHTYTFLVSSVDCVCFIQNIENTEDVVGSSAPVSMAPDAPVSISSIGGSLTSLSLQWASSFGVTGYLLDVSGDPAFNTKLAGYNNLSVSSTSQAVTGLSPATQYYFRVRAVNSGGASPYVSGTSVTTALPPVATNASAATGTSFTANWNTTATATSYLLDVASDIGFTNILAGYSNLAVAGTSQSVSGLTNGATYYYRIRAVNASGNSANSNTITTTTVPGIPGVVTFSAVSATGFQASWTPVPGATSYQVDVSGNAAFSNFATGFNAAVVSNASVTTSGLFPGIVYYIRLRAVNASGISGNSASYQQLLIPPAPSARASSGATAGAFTANWSQALGATAYAIEVADNPGFNPALPGYSGLATASTSISITGLSAGHTYYYHVKASNSSGTSDWSSTISALTSPQPPLAIDATASATGMDIHWLSVESASQYELYISNDQNFSSLLPGYAPKIISGNGVTSETATGLTPLTLYYLKMRAINAAGVSDFSIIRIVSTTAIGGPVAINLDLSLLPQYRTPTDPPGQIQIQATGGTGSLSVKLFHRKNTEYAFLQESVLLQGNSYSVLMGQDWVDEFGMQYYFEVTDLAGQVKRSAEPSAPHNMPIKIGGFTIPIDRFGKEIQNYQILSVPYQLSANRISDLLEPIKGLGAYNKKNWRLVRYEDGVNVDYLDGLSVSPFQAGKAYWFVSRNPVELNLGPAIAPDYSATKPFTVLLKKGWNQIGNPFPFDISWNEVLAANGSPRGISNLQVFNPSTVSFEDADVLKKFCGGFVYFDADYKLTFPATLSRKGTRIQITENYQAEAGEWQVPITLQQGEAKSVQAGIGMHHLAQTGWDRFDRPSPPRFFPVAELVTHQSGLALNQSVVPPAAFYSWNYQVISDQSGMVNLTWSNKQVGQLKGQLTLYDTKRHVLVDMSRTDSHESEPGTILHFIYSESPLIPTDMVQAGTAFPNPFNNQVSFSFLNDNNSNGITEVNLFVHDMTGRRVYESQVFTSKPGLSYLSWNGKSSSGAELNAGWYFYQLHIHGPNHQETITGKLAKQ
ncbi:MAG TPA: fibronectin type III domain-containing protein [Cyclobacteriaceae bacterium]|nr:fibronectin type III domain-containing protein [Cyclobacteriaceae bacterium]